MLKPVTTAAFLCAATMVVAQSAGLSGQQINDLIAGATIEIDTPAGTKLPVRYTREGRLFGEARDLAWYLGSAEDIGRWWVAGDQLCHKWTRWFNAEPQCMRLSNEGRAIRWRSQDGNSGTAAIAIPAPVQASALLALPRVFAKRAAEPARAEAPPELAGARPPQESAQTAAVANLPSSPVAAEIAPEAKPPLPSVPAPGPAIESPSKLDEVKSPAPPKQAEPKRSSEPLFRVTNVRGDDVLNIRSGPSADFEVVGELAPDTRGIAVTSACRAKWCPVVHRATTGWVNSIYLAPEEQFTATPHGTLFDGAKGPATAFRESPDAPLACLTPAARSLLQRIEQQFGSVRVMSTCRTGAIIAGTGRPSRHASGNAVDFDAGGRKAAILEWLIANHRSGGIMTYAGMDHIHVDIGPRFVSLAGGRHWSSWSRRVSPGPQAADVQR